MVQTILLVLVLSAGLKLSDFIPDLLLELAEHFFLTLNPGLELLELSVHLGLEVIQVQLVLVNITFLRSNISLDLVNQLVDLFVHLVPLLLAVLNLVSGVEDLLVNGFDAVTELLLHLVQHFVLGSLDAFLDLGLDSVNLLITLDL